MKSNVVTRFKKGLDDLLLIVTFVASKQTVIRKIKSHAFRYNAVAWESQGSIFSKYLIKQLFTDGIILMTFISKVNFSHFMF